VTVKVGVTVGVCVTGRLGSAVILAFGDGVKVGVREFTELGINVYVGLGARVLVNDAVKLGLAVLVMEGVKAGVALSLGVLEAVGVRLGKGVNVALGVDVLRRVAVKVRVLVEVWVGEGVSEALGVGPGVSVRLGILVGQGRAVGGEAIVIVGLTVRVGVGGMITAVRGSPYSTITPAKMERRKACPSKLHPAVIRRWRVRKYGLLRPILIVLKPDHRDIKNAIPMISKITRKMI